MKRGEKARVTIPPHYAWGEFGLANHDPTAQYRTIISPNAYVIAEIYVLNWVWIEDHSLYVPQ